MGGVFLPRALTADAHDLALPNLLLGDALPQKLTARASSAASPNHWMGWLGFRVYSRDYMGIMEKKWKLLFRV